MNETKHIRHKIGSARTIKTAVLVCQYLNDKCCFPHSEVNKDRVIYEFKDPSPQNGFWPADIFIDQEIVSLADSTRFVRECRAFVAGAGEIW